MHSSTHIHAVLVGSKLISCCQFIKRIDAGNILSIVAAASALSYALTIERIPNLMSNAMSQLGTRFGATIFVVISAVVMMVFGMILEGAPALILFGPLLTPIAAQLGVNEVQFGIVLVIAMGLGLFAPPIGLGLFATCAITGTEVENVVRPMMKYLVVLAAGLLAVNPRPPTLTLAAPNTWRCVTEKRRSSSSPADCLNRAKLPTRFVPKSSHYSE